MRKLNLCSIMALAAFASMTSLTACSSSDDAGEEPNVNPAESVKTTFSLSVALPHGNGNGAKAATRVSEETAQAQSAPVFRGIEDITLIPFGLAGSESVDAPIQRTSQRLGSNITLPGSNNQNANSFPASSSNSGNINNIVYANVSLPQGTSSFLFYGRAINGTLGIEANTDALRHQYGDLAAANLTGEPSEITFTPVQVDAMTSAPAKATTIAQYLTTVAQSSATVGSGDAATTVSWSSQNSDNNPVYNLYTNFIQLRNGSSNSVRIVMQNLYNSLTKVENNALVNEIIKNIQTHATINNGTVTLNDDVAGYPDNANPIPEGVCRVAWNSSDNSFAPNINGDTDNGQLVTAPSALVYPANLQYYVNTNISTSNADNAGSNAATTAWSTVLNNYTAGGQVTPSTRGVALTKQIQYAVGRLDVTLSENASTLKDSKGEDVNGTVATTNGNTTSIVSSFPISAIFVGGQRQVGFDFTPVNTSSSAPQYTIYDTQGPNDWVAAPAGTTAAVAHTLALETPAGEKVRVAVELTNNSGKDFYGMGGSIIYNGAKFYLVAELDPASSEATQPTSGTVNQVIKQDFFTKANLKIDANTDGKERGLGAAYNTLPDLRNPQLSLGLSVDLTWQSGLTFDIVM